MALLSTLAAIAVASTNYSPCSSGQIMADGSRVRFGSVAMNMLPLGTRIYLRPGLYGRHRFTVRDRIGWGSQLDIWTPSCGGAVRYGRRTQRVTVGWPRLRSRVIRMRAFFVPRLVP
jgi:3D (Asp-Asp-Asp) domain-containing protein